MAHLRVNIDLAFKLPLSADVLDKKDKLLAAIKVVKALSEKINAGKENEENTVRAVWHKCFHDTGGACDPEVEI
mgnify:CR=1 FL=1